MARRSAAFWHWLSWRPPRPWRTARNGAPFTVTGRAPAPQEGGHGGVESSVRARAIGPDGRLGTIQAFSMTGDMTASPRVAVNRRGAAVAVWTQDYEGHGFTTLLPSSRRGRSRRTTPFTDATFRPTTVLGADAVALLVWQANDAPVLAARRGGS